MNAASSRITRPCLPRSARATDGSAITSKPDANLIRNAPLDRSGVSGSVHTNSSTAVQAFWNSCAQSNT